MQPNTLNQAYITNEHVANVLALREAYQAVKKRLVTIQASLGSAENELLGSLEAGADVSECGYLVSIQSVERRYPAWKEELISRLGKPIADQIYDTTAPRIYKNLIIKN